MPTLTTAQTVLIVCLSLFTAIAAVTDIRYRRIPNNLTLPVFGLGILYQICFFGIAGLGDAAAGFAVGFGTLFVLWIIGGGGGGDVKLMGALSVWLGMKLTLYVLAFSVLFVILGTFAVMVYSVMTRGMNKTKEQFVASSDSKKKHASRDIKDRRIMAFALPVALATWMVLAWKVPQWPVKPGLESQPQASPQQPATQNKG
ncbi:MAG: A24 family peptidase [Planctomycetales bacterium]